MHNVCQWHPLAITVIRHVGLLLTIALSLARESIWKALFYLLWTISVGVLAIEKR